MQSQIQKNRQFDRTTANKKIILYELNEVPWKIIDLYIDRYPKSHVAKLVRSGHCLTTVNRDPVNFQPWRTWPTLHKSLYTKDHNSHELGQDPATFQGENIWDIAENHGLRIGLFGPMQSWPARPLKNGGFYIPDTFSPTAETIPQSLSFFQAFNLRMTRQNGFSSQARLNMKEVVALGLQLLERGFSAYSAVQILMALGRERINQDFKASRSILQVLPCFDLYWKLHREHRPDLSIFFTNHVAGMMHRYWGDTFPGYADRYQYPVNPIFSRFIIEAMDHFDHQLGKVMEFVDRHPDSVLVVASSMGQDAIPYIPMDETYVLEDVEQLILRLNLGDAQIGSAMYPRTALIFPDAAMAQLAMATLKTVKFPDGNLFDDFLLQGCSLSFAVNYQFNASGLSQSISYSPTGSGKIPQTGRIADIGVVVKTRVGGGNTAYHIPEGILVSYGQDVQVNHWRDRIDILDVAPSLLEILGITAASSIQGRSNIQFFQ
jgi:hypothetical protein